MCNTGYTGDGLDCQPLPEAVLDTGPSEEDIRNVENKLNSLLRTKRHSRDQNQEEQIAMVNKRLDFLEKTAQDLVQTSASEMSSIKQILARQGPAVGPQSSVGVGSPLTPTSLLEEQYVDHIGRKKTKSPAIIH